MSASTSLRALLSAATLASVALVGARAGAVPSCGGQVTQAADCGKSNIYPCCPNGGNCTWWAWESVCRNWHIGLPNWGNANTWAGHAKADPRFDVLGSPMAGSIATRDLGAYGHVAWVTNVSGSTISVTEENCCTGCAPGVGARNYAASYFDTGYVVLHGSECECGGGDKQVQACDCGTRTRACDGCNWSDWGACTGVPEICDGVDNDCDGQIDQGDPQTLSSPPPPFAATLVDASYPQTLHAGELATVWADFRNVGAKTWPQEGVWVGAHGAAGGGQSALFVAGSWPSYDVTTVLGAPVLPGDIGRFTFEVMAPAMPGAQITESFQLQLPGGSFIACPTADFTPSILVLPAGGGAGGSGGAGGAATTESASVAAPSGCSQSPSGAGFTGGAGLALALLTLARARRARRT